LVGGAVEGDGVERAEMASGQGQAREGDLKVVVEEAA